ncbi:MAG: DUF4388 domain-containing protein [Mycobacteriales bacterium]
MATIVARLAIRCAIRLNTSLDRADGLITERVGKIPLQPQRVYREVVVLKGDLATTPFDAVITDLAAPEYLGCLHVEGPDGDEALVYFKSGAIYSVFLPGRRPQLGARLISSGALAPEALEEALEAQATELQGWRLGELLVHLGFVEADVVQAFSVEQVRDACFELSRWNSGKWKFRKNEKTREDIAAPVEVAGILDELLRREQEWAILLEVIGGADSVPTLGAGGLASGEMALNQDEWALLCKVDGERNIHQLARDCGFTDFEAGQIVSSLVMTGLLEIETGTPEAVVSSADDNDDQQAPPLAPRSAAARLMAAFAGGGEDAETDVLDDVDIADADADDGELATSSYFNSLILPLTSDEADLVDADAVGSELTRLLGGRDDADVISDLEVETTYTAPDDDASTAPADASTDDPADAAVGDGPVDGQAAYTSYALPPIDPDAFADEGSGDPDADLPRYSVGFGQRTKFDESLSAVSDALSALLGSQPAASPPLSMFDRDFAPSGESDDEERARIIREAAAAEMAAAHAEMEEQRRRFDDARQRAQEASAEEAAAEEARITAQRDAEAARRAVEAEAARIAAEQEAARRQAEQEAARFQAEQDAERAAAEAAELDAVRAAADEERRQQDARDAEEAARVVAEEAARVAAEDAARLVEQEDAARRADEAAAVAVAAAAAAADEARAAELARADADEAARLAEEVAQQAEEAVRVAAANELAMIELAESPPPAPPAAPPPPAAPAPVATPVMTDTASLMRELSSLGFDDEPAPAAAPSRPSTPVGAAARQTAAQADKGKKRKGLFGRG